MDILAKEDSKAMRAERHRLEKLLRNVALGNFAKAEAMKDAIVIDQGKKTAEIFYLKDPRCKEFYDRGCEMNALFHEFIVDTYKELLGIPEKEEKNAATT